MTDDIRTILKGYLDDPMWANHAEVHKRHLEVAINEIERLRDAMRDERKRCADVLRKLADKHRFGDGSATVNTIILEAAAEALKEQENDRDPKAPAS